MTLLGDRQKFFFLFFGEIVWLFGALGQNNYHLVLHQCGE